MSESAFPKPFGPYVLLKSLGVGGTGDVALARPLDPTRGIPSPLVIKRLHGQLATQDDFVKRFSHEAQLAVAVDSKHVAKVYDVGRVGDTFYMGIEYLPGWALARLIGDLREAGHRASLASVLDIIDGSLSGLAALHSAVDPATGQPLGVVHRDIAPKNIMVGEDGVSRLIDLGLGKSSLQDWRTATGMVMGTPGYMAPEQVAAQDVDHRVDLYAMGIVLWELLTQERFIKKAPIPVMLRAQLSPKFEPASSFRNDVPPALDAVISRAVAPLPEDRFQSAAEFQAALAQAIPAKKRDEPLSTIVGEMLWGELGQAKTEITKLLQVATPAPAAIEISDHEVEVFAARTGVRMSPLLQADDDGDPTHRGHDVYVPPPTPGMMVSPVASQSLMIPSGGVPLKAVAALMAATLAIGIGLGALMLSQRAVDAPLTTAVAAPTPTARPEPSIAPSVVASELPTPPQEPNKIQRRDSSRPTKEPDRPPPPPLAPTNVEAKVEGTPLERVNALLKVVRTKKAGLPPDSPEAAEASKLLGVLAKEAAKGEVEPAVLRDLESQVARLTGSR